MLFKFDEDELKIWANKIRLRQCISVVHIKIFYYTSMQAVHQQEVNMLSMGMSLESEFRARGKRLRLVKHPKLQTCVIYKVS